MSERRVKSRTSRRQPRRATAATEFAFVLPLMMLLALACTDLGRLVHHQTAVANSARTAAEFGSMHHHTAYTRPAWESQIRQAALAELAGVDPQDVSIDIETDEDGLGLFNVRVSVRRDVEMIAPWPGLPASMQITHQVTMRQVR